MMNEALIYGTLTVLNMNPVANTIGGNDIVYVMPEQTYQIPISQNFEIVHKKATVSKNIKNKIKKEEHE